MCKYVLKEDYTHGGGFGGSHAGVSMAARSNQKAGQKI
jgi:hypothetical protein